jgi:hypothetical protein
MTISVQALRLAASYGTSGPGDKTGRVARRIVVAVTMILLSACDATPPGVTDTLPHPPGPAAVHSLGIYGISEVGDTAHATASVVDSAGHPMTDGVTITWRSTNDAVLTVASNGHVTALSGGTAYVVASYETLADSVLLTVQPAIYAWPDTMREFRGEPRSLKAFRFRRQDGRRRVLQVSWSSLDPDIATIDSSGSVTGIIPGHARIELRADAVRDTVDVFVLPNPQLVFREISGSCALTTDDDVYCWGGLDPASVDGPMDRCEQISPSNSSFSFVRSRYPCSVIPRLIKGGVKFVAINGDSPCGIAIDGTGYCWHWWHYRGEDESQPTPIAVPIQDPLAVIYGTCAVTQTHKAYCGIGTSGPIGQVAPSRQWTALSFGSGNMCGLDIDGHIYCWGSNRDHVLGVGSDLATVDSPKPVLAEDGVTLPTFTAIRGTGPGCGLASDSTVYCWGGVASGFAELRMAPLVTDVKLTSFADVYFGVCGVATDGKAYCVRQQHTTLRDSVYILKELNAKPVPPVPLTSLNGNCGIATDGIAYCWPNGVAERIPGQR